MEGRSMTPSVEHICRAPDRTTGSCDELMSNGDQEQIRFLSCVKPVRLTHNLMPQQCIEQLLH